MSSVQETARGSNSPIEAARTLALPATKRGLEFLALHLYQDAKGLPVFWRIRAKHPKTGEKWIRPMKQGANGIYSLGEPDFAGSRPLYRLPELLAASADELVFFVEGEQKADALIALGLPATTLGSCSSESAGSLKPLAGRAVCCWADNDPPGRDHMQRVAKIAQGLGCSVDFVDLTALDLGPADDVMDWLRQHPGATDADVLALVRTPLVAEEASSSSMARSSYELQPTPPHAIESDTGAAVARLSLLSPLEYEQVRLREAEQLGVRPGILDKEVSVARRSKKQESAGAQLCVEVEPCDGPVDLAELFADMEWVVRRFIVCDEPTVIATVLWAAFTWVIDFVGVAPLAVITAPEKRCGKSQLLGVLQRLVKRPVAASSISPAGVFRLIEAARPTLLIDEADTFLSYNEPMRGVLNSGHQRDSAYVVRVVGDEHEPRRFSTWGAKAIAGIGHLPDTIMDRAVILELRRRLPHEAVDRLRHAEPELFAALTARLARFAADCGPDIARARPAQPERLSDRAQDNWEPLLAIADHAGGDWPLRARRAALTISGPERDAQSISNRLLADIRATFERRAADRLTTEDLIQALLADESAPWTDCVKGGSITPAYLARQLQQYAVRPRTIRIGAVTAKGYHRADFADLFVRYLGASEGDAELAVTPSQVDPEPAWKAAAVVTDLLARVGAQGELSPGDADEIPPCDGVTALSQAG